MNNVMLDLETMGNGSNAAIVSIGACFFDPITGVVGAEFEAIVDLESSAAVCDIDAGTILFWMRQNDEARSILLSDEVMTLDDALSEFGDWISQIENPRDRIVWGNGASFDNVILRNAIKAMGYEDFWPFWNDRDVRTIVSIGRDLAGFDPKKDMPFDGVRHSALDDAKHQAKYVSAIYQKFNGATA